jgi:leader peptidase (prepilin peptidase)/N-methyltransferase
MLDHLISFWPALTFIFVIGLIVGSLLNVCIHRMPLEKSILWPGSRCENCYQPIPWFDNIPLLSFLILRGRCRSCGNKFSARYFAIELLTGLAFAGLYYLDVVANVNRLPIYGQASDWWLFSRLPWRGCVVFGTHALLVSFLIVASFCDLDTREIPLGITLPGTALGLFVATIFPWPWPYPPPSAPPSMLVHNGWLKLDLNLVPKQGLYPWPFWLPLPEFCGNGGNFWTGLATGFAGILAGTLLLRMIRFLFSLGLGVEALGLGDADLMMMAGAFLGWQQTVVAFFIGVFAGLLFGLAQLVRKGGNLLPFGPGLAVGIIVTFLCWRWIGPHFQLVFFNGIILVALLLFGSILMLLASFGLRILRH